MPYCLFSMFKPTMVLHSQDGITVVVNPRHLKLTKINVNVLLLMKDQENK